MKITGQTSEDNIDSGLLSNPLSFLRSGSFNYDNAGLNYRSSRGIYWSLRSDSTTNSRNLGFLNTWLTPQNYSVRGDGIAVRCVSNTEWYGGLAPDSICPKGWQLPTIEGDKSFYTLIITSYSMKRNGQTEENNRDSGVLSSPLSFLRSGNFSWSSASLGNRGSFGDYWSLRSANTTASSEAYLGYANLALQSSDARGYGFAVRCVSVYGIDRTIAYFRRNPFRENKVLV